MGQIIQFEDAVTDPANGDAPVDDGTDVVTVYLPDGTSVMPGTSHSGTTPYLTTAQFTPTLAGWHEYVWTSTGGGAGKGRNRFYVSPVP